MGVKLKDIAEQCGTSVATVSYVLSGKGVESRISSEMQELIFDTAERLGYVRKAAPPKPKKPRIAIYWPKKGLETTLVSIMNGVNSAILFDTVPISLTICPYEANNLYLEDDLWSSRVYDAAISSPPARGIWPRWPSERPRSPWCCTTACWKVTPACPSTRMPPAALRRSRLCARREPTSDWSSIPPSIWA